MERNTQKKVIQLLRIVISVLFVFSAVAKLYPIEAFEKQLVDLGFASWTTAPFLSRSIIGFEAFLGLAFLQKNFLRSIVIPATTLLLLAFCIHLGYVIYTTGGNSGNCGCFGQLLPMTPIEALIKNFITLIMLGYLYSLTKRYESQKWGLPIGIFAFTYLILFTVYPVKSYITNYQDDVVIVEDSTDNAREDSISVTSNEDSIVNTAVVPKEEKQNTTVKVIDTNKQVDPVKKDSSKTVKSTPAYTPKTSIYAPFKTYNDGLTANVDKGTSIVALLSLECEHCMETARKIGELNQEKKLPPVYFLFFGSPGQVESFFEVAKYKFPYKIIEPQVFFPLLGDNPSPPRVSVLKEGNIVADFNFDSFSKEKLKKAIEQ